MSVHGASKIIVNTLLSWENIETHPNRFGGTEFRIGKREIGHIHGDLLVDIPFPKKVRDEIVSAGEAQPHHILPETGWVSFYFREEGNVERALALLKRSYEIALKQKNKKIFNHTFSKLMSLRAAVLVLWQRGNLIIKLICLLTEYRIIW